MDIVHGNIGSVAKYDLELVNGNLEGKISIPVELIVKQVLDKAKAAIPGQVDDMLIDAIMLAVFSKKE